jgi:hypothetical protein
MERSFPGLRNAAAQTAKSKAQGNLKQHVVSFCINYTKTTCCCQQKRARKSKVFRFSFSCIDGNSDFPPLCFPHMPGGGSAASPHGSGFRVNSRG